MRLAGRLQVVVGKLRQIFQKETMAVEVRVRVPVPVLMAATEKYNFAGVTSVSPRENPPAGLRRKTSRMVRIVCKNILSRHSAGDTGTGKQGRMASLPATWSN